MNRNLLMYMAITAGFVASAQAVAGAVRWAASGEAPAWVEHFRPAEHAPDVVPSVLHELELARLAGLLQQVRDGDHPAKHHHERATTAAYDSVLLDSCRTLGLDAPRGPVPLTDSQRLDVESRLLSAGMSW